MRLPAGAIVDAMKRTITAASRARFEIRAYVPQDEPQVLKLLCAAFGNWPLGIEGQDPSEFFRWKHMASPFGPSILLVAEANGAVIGFEGWLRWKLRVGGRTFEALRGVDMAVHPEHRRRGVQTALMHTATEHFPKEVPFLFMFPNKDARPGALKAGRREVGSLPRLVRIRDPVRVGIAMVSKRYPSRGFATSARGETELAADALQDGQNVSSLLSETEESTDRFTTVKNLDYLRWRYGALAGYRAIRVEQEGRLAGMAVYRIRRRGSLRAATICELLVARGDLPTAQTLLRRVVRATPVDFLTCHFPSRHLARRAAIRGGFFRLPGGPVALVDQLKENFVPDPSRPASWALCLGDLDLF